MPAHGVNVGFTNWHTTGVNVSIAQYEVDISVEWLDDLNDVHTWSGTVLFPNVLADVPLAWLRPELERLTLMCLRKRAKLDDRYSKKANAVARIV